MFNLNLQTSIIYLGMLYMFYFSLGYLLLHFSDIEKFKHLPFMVRLPIYLSLGLSVSTVLFFLIGLLKISRIITLIIYILSLLSFFAFIFVKDFYKYFKEVFKQFDYVENILPLVLFLITFFYFSSLIGFHKWPPIGDLISHGALTSLLKYNQKITFNFEPYNNATLHIPIGFHITATYISDLLSIYPAESIFLLGGAIIIIFPSLLYSLVYFHTNSKTFSLIAFLSSYIIYFPHLESWFMGYFFNGPYPCMYGFLLAFVATSLITLEEKLEEQETGPLSLLIMVVVALFLVYPNFVIYPLATFLVFKWEKLVNIMYDIFCHFWQIKKILFTILITVSCYVVLYSGFFDFISKLIENYILQGQSFEFYNLKLRFILYISQGFLFQVFLLTIFLTTSLFISAYYLKKNRNVTISLQYLLIFLVCFLSVGDYFFKYLGIFLPTRSLMIGIGFAWVLTLSFLHDLLEKNLLKKYDKIKIKISLEKEISFRIFAYFLISFLILYLFYPTLSLHLLPQGTLFEQGWVPQGTKYGWFPMYHDLNYRNSFEALEWIHENIMPEDLILNDLTWISYWAMSLSYKNLVFMRGLGSARARSQTEYLELFSIWLYPENKTLVNKVLKKYNIKYILITPLNSYFTTLLPEELSGKNVKKPYKPDIYIRLFDSYSFLSIEFAKESNIRVYKVLLDKL